MARSTDLTTLPLRQSVYHILLALSGRDLHGLGIADEIEAVSDGALELGPGTLYRSLSEMAEAGLVRGVSAPGDEVDPRRKYYGITPAGATLLARETARMSRLVDVARARTAMPEKA